MTNSKTDAGGVSLLRHEQIKAAQKALIACPAFADFSSSPNACALDMATVAVDAAIALASPPPSGVREALDWLVNCIECEVNVPGTTTVFQLRLAKAKEALSQLPATDEKGR